MLNVKAIEKDILDGPYPENVKEQVSALVKRIGELEEEREKLKPFVDIFNEFHGTNLTIGADTVNTTFEEYHIVSKEEYKRLKISEYDYQKVINELTEMVSEEGRISEFELRRNLKERYPHLF